MSDSSITMTGNVVADPDLRYTPGGHAWCRFRLASSQRYYDANSKQWKDANTTFIDVVAWRALAEHVAESVERGSRVVVHGRLVQRSWDDKDGVKQYRYEIDADEVAASLRMATVTIQRSTRAGADQHTTQPAAGTETRREPTAA
ncbi:MAG TPA: single-stranded DNA-binding protein [Mycobacteriales bacterium]|jgi:single-strand DNA-binding protein|nr:single-stranded DNA-binding protein [Mycobacteriales bacterium]